jgi:transcriptional regulator with XRE-family HTH domain
MTQQKLCDMVGTVPQYLTRYESGKVAIPVRLVAKFADVLGTRPGWISYGQGDPFTFLVGAPVVNNAPGHLVSTVVKGLSSRLLTTFRQETGVRHTVKVELEDGVVYALAGDHFLLLIVAFKPVRQVLSRSAGRGMETVSVAGASAARIAEGEGRKDLIKVLSALSKEILPHNAKSLADMCERRNILMTGRNEWAVTVMVKRSARMTKDEAGRVLIDSIDLNKLPPGVEVLISDGK